MARYFPIFIDLGRSPPLVVGAGPALAAKLRLLAGFAPQTDLLTGLQALPPDLDLPGVRHIAGMPLDRAPQLFSGRPLVLIDTGDAELDQMLSRRARETGVPVNVPDRPGLCSFYLGSIVDRDPVVLAISTGGLAPVLAQRLRAAIEDWVPRRYGRLALHLNRVRQRIRTLPAARRRRLQHRIIDGDETRADALVVELLAGQEGHDEATIHVIGDSASDPVRATRREIEAIRNADVILHAPGEVPDLVRLARREVELVPVSDASAPGRAAAMRASGLEVVIVEGNRPAAAAAKADGCITA